LYGAAPVEVKEAEEEEEVVEEKTSQQEETKEPIKREKKQIIGAKEGAEGVDKYVGKYQTSDELHIGDRDMSKLIDVCEKNNKKF